MAAIHFLIIWLTSIKYKLMRRETALTVFRVTPCLLAFVDGVEWISSSCLVFLLGSLISTPGWFGRNLLRARPTALFRIKPPSVSQVDRACTYAARISPLSTARSLFWRLSYWPRNQPLPEFLMKDGWVAGSLQPSSLARLYILNKWGPEEECRASAKVSSKV